MFTSRYKKSSQSSLNVVLINICTKLLSSYYVNQIQLKHWRALTRTQELEEALRESIRITAQTEVAIQKMDQLLKNANKKVIIKLIKTNLIIIIYSVYHLILD